jgi:anti-sigma regulatory factor (Ser/Thr protein kinase)
MTTCPPTDLKRRCLIPFQAEPETVGRLRQAVGLQLGVWGAESLAEAALLTVSELATNVLRHVGEGACAALVMEAHDDRLRIELHDTSRAMPHPGQAGPEDENGRGLALVDAVTDRWFAVATPGGKAVCCEFGAVFTQGRFTPRAARGAEVVQNYVLRRRITSTVSHDDWRTGRLAATDLVTDLLHWLAATGADPDTVLDHAQM